MEKGPGWNRKERLLNEADRLVLTADMLAFEQKYEEAIKNYDRALEIVPNNADLWAFKGITLEGGLGMQDEAMQCWDTAMRLDHDIAEAVDMSDKDDEPAGIEGIDLSAIQGSCKDTLIRLMMREARSQK